MKVVDEIGKTYEFILLMTAHTIARLGDCGIADGNNAVIVIDQELRTDSYDGGLTTQLVASS